MSLEYKFSFFLDKYGLEKFLSQEALSFIKSFLQTYKDYLMVDFASPFVWWCSAKVNNWDILGSE